jgi:hypothetical protein
MYWIKLYLTIIFKVRIHWVSVYLQYLKREKNYDSTIFNWIFKGLVSSADAYRLNEGASAY